ncbi:nicotinate-nucleotide--dimethylbenzimidazole phosphoribosyltransferase [Limoniibacter endophyticus]|uniref:Nicotinate-nucleotide--dimethylbenzimidazole phosphoribosyltransferase n=1 Tax=Limoniibacter endophyticus TaxID=1565040 RepID=A0A8J3DP41_9HYPH|nr:nicotinate-nucleotide--dimethylbenzimidazole phosphoribosyltransferase [Limoniibacter endophyticus]GHC75782.1 nicotinate-nucleotide--dimethylbenzimidazole phosphoribosyltransferase [Limoniibacter endophyticus]
MTSGLPFDDIRNLVKSFGDLDEDARRQVLSRYRIYGPASFSTGRIEQVAAQMAAIFGRTSFAISRPLVAVFAANHEIANRGVSPRTMEMTAQNVGLCGAGQAPVSAICAQADMGLKVLDLALEYPTADISKEAAFDERDCAATIAFGMETIAGGIDLLCIGDIGVGNSTVSGALLAALLGGRGADWVGPGSGADERVMARKAELIDAALDLNGGNLKDPLEALRRVGGREIAAIVGAIVAARAERIPVVISGLPAIAAAAVLHRMSPAAISHCVLADLPPEAGAVKAAEILELEPILNLSVPNAAGAQAALAGSVLRSVAASVPHMAS